MSISWRVRHIALGGCISIHTAFAARKAGHGNDRVWKAWKAMKPASHPSRTLWKSLSTRNHVKLPCNAHSAEVDGQTPRNALASRDTPSIAERGSRGVVRESATADEFW